MVQPRLSGSDRLPELRQELRLHPGPHDDVERTWLVYDPVRHRYFQLSQIAFELLKRWRTSTAEALLQRTNAETLHSATLQDVEQLRAFLFQNHLTLEHRQGDPLALAAAKHKGLLLRAAHNYLFFKVPLLRPERFLATTMPLVEPLFTRIFASIIVCLFAAGLYLASRQWDIFVTTFLDFLTFEGIAAYGATLIAVKAMHELGHAYTATRFGVRVTTMGIAFMVLTPILYTDVSDAWRLRHRSQKLAIDAAGIVVELGLASIALFLWAFLPDGPFRSGCFVVATTSLALGLAINLNPLMRFDGYHLLADGLRIPNLQVRSGALAQWRIRELLFGLGRPAPEQFSPRMQSFLIVYAVASWIYRVSIYIGIAIAVYYMFFKALGLILFLIEIHWFVVLPMASEIRDWWRMRSEIRRTRRFPLVVAFAAMVLVFLFVPWSGNITVQAIVQSDLETRIFAPRTGKIDLINIAEGKPVRQGETLIALQAPDLDHEIKLTGHRIELATYRLARIAGDNADRADRAVLESELALYREKLKGLREERRQMTIVASYEGIARDVDFAMRPGEWLDETKMIGRIIRPSSSIGHAYVTEDTLHRVEPGSPATFIPEDPLVGRVQGRVEEVVTTGARTLDVLYVASLYGGSIPADRTPDNEIRPRSAHHLVKVRFDIPSPDRVMRGRLHISGKHESIAAAIWRRVLQVLVREASA